MVDAIHEISDMFMEEIGFPFWELSMEHGFGLPLVKRDFQLEHPVEAGDVVTIELTPDLGERSVRFEYAERRASIEAFSGHEQRACVPKSDDSTMSLSEALRVAIEAYVDG